MAFTEYYAEDDYHEDTIDDDIAALKAFIAGGDWLTAQSYLHDVIVRSDTRDAILDLAEEMADEAETVKPKKGTDWTRLRGVRSGDYL